jgi:hypothetical protein
MSATFPITPEMIRSASEDTGIKPVTGSWGEYDEEGRKCACGLSILVARKIGFDELLSSVDFLSSPHDVYRFIGEKLGLTPWQVQSFERGFDGLEGYRNSEFFDRDAYFAGLDAMREIDP